MNTPQVCLDPQKWLWIKAVFRDSAAEDETEIPNAENEAVPAPNEYARASACLWMFLFVITTSEMLAPMTLLLGVAWMILIVKYSGEKLATLQHSQIMICWFCLHAEGTIQSNVFLLHWWLTLILYFHRADQNNWLKTLMKLLCLWWTVKVTCTTQHRCSIHE